MAAAAEYDFIVVGSGAGGGPLACRLALAPEGYRVALVEAGTDPVIPGTPTFYNHSVPGLHARATEDPKMSWEFFVQHYTAEARQREDSKFNKEGGGVFYPRAAALGGCTAHHAMITLYPHNDDWKGIQDLTGDETWSPERMREYFVALEDCQYQTPKGPNRDPDTVTRHGFNGWLPLSMPDSTLVLGGQSLEPDEKCEDKPLTTPNPDEKPENRLLTILVYAFLAAHLTKEQLEARS
jgi:choline dehydrogenase